MSAANPTRHRPVISRRGFLAGGMATAAFAASGQVWAPHSATAATGSFVIADDAAHVRTWMAWPSSRTIWGSLLDGVQHDVALVATTIARYEPVVMCANPSAAATARRLCGPSVQVIETISVNDCWMRDTCAVVRRTTATGRDTIGLGFNGWGRKQAYGSDSKVAGKVAVNVGLNFARAGFVGEGGAIETDGDGTVMATESSLVNANRNRGMTKAQIERAILDAYGATKMIWVAGVRGQDITDDHIDATSRFIRPGVVMVQVPPSYRTDVYAQDARQQLAVLRAATDARGRRLQVIEMAGPDALRDSSPDFLDSYVNFAVVNGAVVTAQFGDAAKDAACRATLTAAFPTRTVVQLDVDRLHGGGGGIHCITMQEPR